MRIYEIKHTHQALNDYVYFIVASISLFYSSLFYYYCIYLFLLLYYIISIYLYYIYIYILSLLSYIYYLLYKTGLFL